MEVFRAIWRRRWHILTCGFFVALAFFTTAARMEKIYIADATMLLDPRGQQIVSVQTQVVDDLQLTNATLESAVAVLQSESLLRDVIEKHGVRTFSNIRIKDRDYGILGRSLDVIKSLLGARSRDPDMATVTPDERRLAHISFALREGIQAERMGNSYVIRLRVSTLDPEISALVANGLIKAFIERQLHERQLVATAAEDWLAAQVARQRADLLQAEIAIQQFMERWIEDDGIAGAVLEQQMAELNRQRAMTRADIAAQSARLRQIENHRARSGDTAVAETQATDVFRKLRSKAQTLTDENEKLATLFGASHPQRVALQTDLKLVREEIALEVDNLLQAHRNELEVLNLREQSLAQEVSDLEEGRVTASRAMLELRQLEAEAKVTRTSYEALSSRLENVRAQAEIQRSEARVMTFAQIPTGPSEPRPKLMGFFGATIGTSVGFLAVLVLEAMGPGFRSVREMENATGVRVLTSFPSAQDVNLKSRTGISGASDEIWKDRLLRLKAALDRMPSSDVRKIMITTAQYGTDQARVAYELAQLAQSAGRNAVVISLGDQRSQIQAIKSVMGDARLEPLSVEAAAKPEPSFSTLDLSDLHLSAPEIQTQIEAFEEHFDFIIFDTPAMQGHVDGLVLAPHVDQVLLVLDQQKSHRNAVYAALDALSDVGVEATGFVMSEVASGFDASIPKS